MKFSTLIFAALLDIQSSGWGKPYYWKEATVKKLLAAGIIRRVDAKSKWQAGTVNGYHLTEKGLTEIRAAPHPKWFAQKWRDDEAQRSVAAYVSLKEPRHSMSGPLPDCMAPDGAEPCNGYRVLLDQWIAQKAILQNIETLRTECAASVEICCNDEEADHVDRQMCIIVYWEHSDWLADRYYGRDLAACLEAAISARAKYLANKK